MVSQDTLGDDGTMRTAKRFGWVALLLMVAFANAATANMYWTDPAGEAILSAELDGSNVEILVTRNSSKNVAGSP